MKWNTGEDTHHKRLLIAQHKLYSRAYSLLEAGLKITANIYAIENRKPMNKVNLWRRHFW